MIAEEMRRVSKDRLGAPLVFWTTLARWATEVEALEAKAKELDRVKAALIEAGTTPIEGSAEYAVWGLDLVLCQSRERIEELGDKLADAIAALQMAEKWMSGDEDEPPALCEMRRVLGITTKGDER